MDDRAAQDQRVVRQILEGDADAFGELVTRYQKLVASVAWRYGIRQEEIEDVVSEVFFKAYDNLGRFRPEHAFSTWLYRLAANHVIDHGRRAKRRGKEVELSDGLRDPSPAAIDRVADRERDRIVRSVLEELKPRYREVLFLVYVEGCSVEESARTLGLPQGTIKSRLMRGREAMRNILSRRHPEFFTEPD